MATRATFAGNGTVKLRRRLRLGALFLTAALVAAPVVIVSAHPTPGHAVAAKKCHKRKHRKCKRQRSAPTFTLTILKTGSGSGTVSDGTGAISCGAACTASYRQNTSVTLTATPATGSGFLGWSGGGCSGTGSCVTTVTQAESVTAPFTLGAY